MAEYHRRGGLNKWNLFLAVLDQGASMASSGEGSHPVLQTESSLIKIALLSYQAHSYDLI